MCDASVLKGLLIFMSLAYELRIPVVVAAKPALHRVRRAAGMQVSDAQRASFFDHL